MVGCVFLSQNWAPLVKKKIFHFFFGQEKNHCLHLNWKTTKQKFLILFNTRNQQPIFSNKSVINSPALNSQMVGCVFLSQNWAPLWHWKNLQMVGCVFLSQNWAPLWHWKNLQMVGCVFFVPKLGTTLTLKKFTNGWLRFFVPKLGTTR